MRSVLGLSGSGTFQILIGTASYIGLVRIISVFGSEALAGYTIGIRVIIFALLPSFGSATPRRRWWGRTSGRGGRIAQSARCGSLPSTTCASLASSVSCSWWQGSGPNPGAIRRVGFFGDGHVWISEGQGSGPYTLWMAPVLGGEPRRFLTGAMEPAWSPDGKAMAYHTAEPGDPIFVADRNGRSPKKIFTAESGNHCHYLTWSPDGRFLYFVMGGPATDEMDVWRIPVFATTPVTPERITTHNSRVAYLGWLDDRTLIYSGTADDGSGEWLYALDSEHRVPHRVSSGITEQYLSVTVSNTEPRRLIASVATPSANLWTVPISDRVQTEADVSRFPWQIHVQ